jgi:hypothetical protein
VSVIESTQAELIGTKNRMLQLLHETPADRVNWKPTPTGRSIVEIVAHCGHAIENILQQLKGTLFAPDSSAEANRQFLAHDAQFQNATEVEAYLEQKCADYIEFLGTLKPEDLDTICTLPFGLGQAPLGYFMTMGNAHTQGHIAQIEYIQTLYGDHEWHAGF